MNDTAPGKPVVPQEDELQTMLTAGKSQARWRKVVLLVVVAVLILIGVGFWTGVLGGSTGASDQPAYVTETVNRGDLETSITATGNVKALNTVEVGTEVSGKILALHADYNDPVTKGQLLAEIDPEQLQAAEAQAKAQVLAARASVREARASLAEARLDAERSKDLAKKGLLSNKDLESAVAKAERADASLASAKASSTLAEASYDAARSRLGKTEIRSPINGSVLSRAVEVGQTLNAGMQTPVLFTIAEDLRRMRISSRVDEADIGSVAVGQDASFTVDAYPENKFTSKVESVRNVSQVEQNVVSYEVLLSVENPDLLLKPGMTTTVEIITMSQKNVLLVTNKALRFTPPSMNKDSMRGPPGMSFLNTKTTTKESGTPVSSLGKLDSHEGIVWTLQNGSLRPLKVTKLATNGVKTAVKSDELKAGMEILIDLADSGKTTK